MKVYKRSFHDPGLGLMLSWHSSRREAERALRLLQSGREEPQGVEAVDAVDIPTDRAGLLRWLNQHLDADNG